MKQTRHLLLDDRVVARAVNARLTVTQAAKSPANPLWIEDRPWELKIGNGYPNVLLDPADGLYKCWYFTWVKEIACEAIPRHKRVPGTWGTIMYGLRKPGTPGRTEGLCYAVSRDGLTWTKPSLNLVSYKGSRKNNIVTRKVHGGGVFLDAHEADPAKRYKMFFRGDKGGRYHKLAAGFSADGLRWRSHRCPEIDARADTHNNAIWAPTLGKYVGITRKARPSKLTVQVRQVARTISDDFVHWSKARVVLEGLEDDLQIYSMPIWYHAGVYLGLPTILQISTDRAWPELAWSPDTVHWHRVDPGRPLIACNPRRGTYDWGCIYPSRPVILDDAIRVFYMGSDGPHTDWRNVGLCLATLRPDGFAGYEPIDRRTGAVVATELMPGSRSLRLTADVRRGGSVRVIVRDARSRIVARSRPIRRTGTDTPVSWSGSAATEAQWPGRARLEFHLRDAKLNAFTVAEGS